MASQVITVELVNLPPNPFFVSLRFPGLSKFLKEADPYNEISRVIKAFKGRGSLQWGHRGIQSSLAAYHLKEHPRFHAWAAGWWLGVSTDSVTLSVAFSRSTPCKDFRDSLASDVKYGFNMVSKYSSCRRWIPIVSFQLKNSCKWRKQNRKMVSGRFNTFFLGKKILNNILSLSSKHPQEVVCFQNT